MQITFTRLNDDSHRVEVLRADGSTDAITLNSRSFLRHDFAHLAVEAELPIALRYWGQVAAGAALGGDAFSGQDIALAEKLAGPVQTLMRTEAQPAAYLALLQRVVPALARETLAQRIHEHAPRLTGQWTGTPFGSTMRIRWWDQDEPDVCFCCAQIPRSMKSMAAITSDLCGLRSPAVSPRTLRSIPARACVITMNFSFLN